MYQRLKLKALSGLAELVTHRPRLVLTLAVLAALACVYVTLFPVTIPVWGRTLGPLAFQSNRNDLISPRLDWNQRFIRWAKDFPGTSDMIIVADAGDPHAPGHEKKVAAVQAFIDELGPALTGCHWVKQSVWGFNKLDVSAKAVRLADLNLAQPTDEFRGRLEEIRGSAVLLASQTPSQFVGRIIAEMRKSSDSLRPEQAADQLRSFGGVLDAFAASLGNQSDQPTDLGKLVVQREEMGQLWQYLVSDNGRLFFVRVTPRPDLNQINALEPAISEVRRVLNLILAKYPGVDAGLTGIDVVEADETDAATWDGTTSSILAVVGITLLMLGVYHSVRMPLMHTTSLLIAIAWTFGFTTLFVGHLQVISVIFVPILLGLGIAYGIYLTSRFEMVRHRHPDTPQGHVLAMRDAFETMGPGIITGCVTTALAFMTTLLTDFTGVAEMGLISGVGVVLCLVSMFTVFPAMVRLVKPAHSDIVPLDERAVRFYDRRWFMPFARHPWVILTFGAVLTGISLLSLGQMRFDYNLMKLQPAGMASVEWEQRIVEDAGESIWFGVSIVPDLESARRVVEKYRKLPTVRVIRGIGLLMPADEAEKIQLLTQAGRDIDQQVAAMSGQTSPPVSLLFQMQILKLAFDAQTRGVDIPPEVKPHLESVRDAMGRVIRCIESQPVDVRARRLARLDEEFNHWRTDSKKSIEQATDPSPLDLGDLPASLLWAYQDVKGNLSIEVFPALPDPAKSSVRDVLDPQFLPVFIRDLRSVDPQVTGVAVQIYESGTLIKHSYIFAGVLGMVLVFLTLVLDFHNLRDAILALVPVIVGFAVTFGIMRLTGMTINAANIIVLPLMFGIGVDSGVHLIYRSRMDPTGEPPGLSQGTGLGVIVVNLTTIIGFGVMAIPHIEFLHIGVRHRGILSLGFVLTVGMTMTLLACLTIMPAWLQLRRNHQARRRSGAS